MLIDKALEITGKKFSGMGAYWREPGSKGDGKSTGYWKREGGKQDSQGARKNRTNLATILNIFRAKKRQIGATNKEMWEPGVKELERSPPPPPSLVIVSLT